MMAQPVPHPSTDKKRVKVYELRNNDWFDRGTGFCTASFISIDDVRNGEPRVIVESEDQPERLLLETRICKEDGFQKQQETLIVWTEPSNGIDMALSFQEAEGCAMIWKFISGVQQSFGGNLGGPDDSLSDDLAMDIPSTVSLPPAELGNLRELEENMRVMSSTATGRDALAKCIMTEDYIRKLIPLVEMAEDLESLTDLHHLCNIIKIILLLNDTSIIEHAVSDDLVLGVVGALEYDPDFPSHKANHRRWLNNQGRFKEVVRIKDDQIRRRIHQTYRLQYLKDVVLARILDDPTFSVLNSLIFFNQVDIVQHLQTNASFLSDLFGIFSTPGEEPLRKEAVMFIQQCCAIAKNLQPPGRMTLYNNFLSHGLLHVINFGLRNLDVAVRVGATDILVSMIDHDPTMIRQTIYRQIQEKQVPLTETLIDLLLVEVDLGVKSQLSDALKVLLDPNSPGQPPENMVIKGANGEYHARPRPSAEPYQEIFLNYFYDHSILRLFKPLLDLEGRTELKFSVLNDGIFSYLNEIMCFCVRQHNHRSKFFVLQHNIAHRFLQLLGCREKHMQLVGIRFVRYLVGLGDEFYNRHIMEKRLFEPILDLLMRTLPHDNLLSSACLEIFESMRKDTMMELIKHSVEAYHDKIQDLSYMDLFAEILIRGDTSRGYANSIDPYFLEGEEDSAMKRAPNGAVRGLMDPEEEVYWNTSDDEDEGQAKLPGQAPSANGSSPMTKRLVDYPSDEEAEESDDADTEMAPQNPGAEQPKPEKTEGAAAVAAAAAGSHASPAAPAVPPERLSEKRRREEDEEEDLGKVLANKRRNSSSASMNASAAALRKKKSFAAHGLGSNGSKKVTITISPSLKVATGHSPGQDDNSAV